MANTRTESASHVVPGPQAIDPPTNGQKSSFVISTVDCHEDRFLKGWRLYVTTLGLMICLYLVNVEVTIVSTSLITIANDFHSFNRTSWVVTGYLITYTGFIILWSKLSDIIGRKSSIIATMIVFMAFSLGCGAAQSMAQLIICRAFQGIGSAGAYSISILLCYEIVPKSELPTLGALASLATALGFSTGPLIGGVLANHSIWRWIFFLNLPLGAVAVLLLIIALPSKFGGGDRKQQGSRLSFSNLRRVDIVGALILLTATLPLITALNEVYVQFNWSDGRTIILIALSGVAWYAFIMWEHAMTRDKAGPEPIFPSRFLYQASWMGMLLTTFLVGMPSNMVVVMLPQRFQIVGETSALSAGVRLLAYSTVSAVSAGLSSLISKRARIPFVYLLLFSSILHTVGMALLSTLPETSHFPWTGYVYEAIAGAGVGITFGILVLATPFVVEPRDIAVAAGAIIQFRFLGGAIGLAIGSNVLNGMLTLTESQREAVQAVFAHGYTIQFRIMIGIAAAQFPAALLMLRKGRQITALD